MFKGSLLNNIPKSVNKKEIKLKPLDKKIVKLNIDEASKGNPCILGVGCILRDSMGLVVAALATKAPNDTNNMVEARALVVGLKLAMKFKVRQLIIEGDS
ncbi:hypothetical protein SUGI_0797900 [Cryptomeria japonica]|nr:hypothetical protein SUGI_0797900 [Cryptomeria japonica]